MKKFKLKSDEELIKIYSNIEVEANKNKFILTLFLTNNRLVLLKNINKELEFNAFLASNLVNIPENLEVAFAINLDEIEKIVNSNKDEYFKLAQEQFETMTNSKNSLEGKTLRLK